MKQIGTSWDRDNRNTINENFTEAERKVLEQKQRVDRLIQDAPQPSEVVDARGEHAVLGDRLNDFAAQLVQKGQEISNLQTFKADKDYVDIELTKKTDKAYVDAKTQANNLAYKESYSTLTALQTAYPNGDSYNHVVLSNNMIYTWVNGSWTNTQIQANGTGIAKNSVNPEHTTFVATGKNLFDKSRRNINKVVNYANGQIVDSTGGNSSTHFIPVKPSTNYYRSIASARQVAYYDVNKQYISGQNAIDYLFTTPANCYFVITNFPEADVNEFQVEEGNLFTGYEPFRYRFNTPFIIEKDSITGEEIDFVEKSKNLFNKHDVLKGHVISTSGNITPTTSGNSLSGFIPVRPYVSYTRSFDGPLQVCYFDKNKNFISGANEPVTFTTPANCYYIRLNFVHAMIDAVQVEEGTESTPYEPYGYQISLNDNKDILGVMVELNRSTSKLFRIDGLQSLEEIDQKYPFNSIRLCNVKKMDWGATRITYEHEPGFARDGSNGEVMVEIPKVYFKRYRHKTQYSDIEFLLISGTQKDGFIIDPAFVENGKELNAIYVSAYDGTVVDGKLRSVSGLMPSSGENVTQYRQYAKNNGQGFGLLDYRTVALLQRLFMVYYADRNSQNVLGSGLVGYSWQSAPETVIKVSATQTNTVRINNSYVSYQERGFAVGMNVTVSVDGSYWKIDNPRKITDITIVGSSSMDITFDGAPVDVTAEVSRIYSLPQDSGTTDGINHHTGVSNVFDGKDGHEAIKFFHIENLWGNIWPFLDGYVINDLVAYVGENMDDYSSDLLSIQEKYVPLSFKVPLQDTNKQDENERVTAYVKSLMFEKQYPAYMLPEALGNGATDTVGYCDPFYSYATGTYIAAFGGGIDHLIRAGLFTFRTWFGFDSTSPILCGARTIYKEI